MPVGVFFKQRLFGAFKEGKNAENDADVTCVQVCYIIDSCISYWSCADFR